LAVNLVVELTERFDDKATADALRLTEARGFQFLRSGPADDRLAAWIDWQFAPSWWSAEARAGDVLYALDARGEIAGFAAFDVRGLHFPWLREYAGRTDIGVFGPYGVAPAHRKTGLGQALLLGALNALRAKGYVRALIPAVGYDRLIAMYEERVGARVADTYSYDSARRFRVTILASGGGTNAQNVFDRVRAGQLPLDVVGLIANSSTAQVLARARRAGVPVADVVWNRGSEPRAAYDARVIGAVGDTQPDLVLLLGWMHVLPPAFIERFPEILNVHPAFLPFDPCADDVVLPDGAVLPAFRGAHAVRDALAVRAPWIGASVHRVTTETDRGAIVVRTPLRLAGLATQDDVYAQLRRIEHAAVGAAIRRWCFEQN
jgi:phosphoribosylglycinamide formyltransferase-1